MEGSCSTTGVTLAMEGTVHGWQLAKMLAQQELRVGELLPLPGVFEIAGRGFTHAVLEHEFRTKSRARLLRLLPGDAMFISKSEDIQQEAAVMCAMQRMNRIWRERGIEACGLQVEAVTYSIIPLGNEGGLVEVVPKSATLRELDTDRTERHLRVVEALDNDVSRLDKLAATTVAYLTAGYALGVRDGHDDNIMLREDGALFRIDFGFAFGDTPGIDTPQTIVPHAIFVALKSSRWTSVVRACRYALIALTGEERDDFPAWQCLRNVPELWPYMSLAYLHVSSLSLAGFCEDVERANEWSFRRAAKNRLREALRYVTEEAAHATGCAPRRGIAALNPGISFGLSQAAAAPPTTCTTPWRPSSFKASFPQPARLVPPGALPSRSNAAVAPESDGLAGSVPRLPTDLGHDPSVSSNAAAVFALLRRRGTGASAPAPPTAVPGGDHSWEERFLSPPVEPILTLRMEPLPLDDPFLSKVTSPMVAMEPLPTGDPFARQPPNTLLQQTGGYE